MVLRVTLASWSAPKASFQDRVEVEALLTASLFEEILKVLVVSPTQTIPGAPLARLKLSIFEVIGKVLGIAPLGVPAVALIRRLRSS